MPSQQAAKGSLICGAKTVFITWPGHLTGPLFPLPQTPQQLHPAQGCVLIQDLLCCLSSRYSFVPSLWWLQHRKVKE